MASVALLSNPRSTGNLSMLPRMRSYCAAHSDVFHYEVESIEQIGEALRTIARVNPKVLVVNGGDGTVQAALTELYLGGHFDGSPPPVAVLPNGKTNLIALDLGAVGDPIAALAKVIEIARNGVEEHVVDRELIALSDGTDGARPVLGMFLGGAGLADTILYCRNKIYPLGLPNGISHVLTAIAVLATLILGIRTAFLPPAATPLKVSMMRQGQLHGRFSLLIVTTLHKLLLGSSTGGAASAGPLQMMVVEQRPLPLLRALFAGIFGRVGRNQMDGVHFERGDEIRIEGERSSVVLDGEIFQADAGRPIILKTTPPVPFLRLAA
ncbi:diacylglycerol kinase [Sphingomonas sp. Root710]|uniref:diacylglycerol/lipid kinase family protein n=1 Tax=Sphingomonas sp. Root710 TaxID=1736594 RepID=UPI0006F6023C|nr:diacylglycerol kinase family protein [Sphingomonas sp. Root710]KRB82491.1 diacylglycerol kinase [Sphingomonas sp. Root710]